MTHTTDYRERYSAGWSQDSVRLFHVASAFAKSTYFYVQECGYFQTDDTYFTERSFRRVMALSQQCMISSELLTSNVITSILTELTIQSMTNNATHLLLPEPIKQVIIDIEHNFKSDLSLQSLASRHNISKFHLSKEFKKYTGCTVMEYIIANRLAYAKELLKYSDLSVSEITERIGMHNISHFIHLFKAREGMTPLAFRRQWK